MMMPHAIGIHVNACILQRLHSMSAVVSGGDGHVVKVLRSEIGNECSADACIEGLRQ